MKKSLTFKTQSTIRLDEFLRQEFPAAVGELNSEAKGTDPSPVSNSKIRRMIMAGCVAVNGRECRRPAFELRGRSFVNVNFDEDKFFFEKQPDDIKFEMSEKDILFEDENLIFINKPYNFPVEQTITGNRDNLHDCLVDFLWKRNPELRNPPYAGIMHRLDKDTSGLILFTKNRAINKVVSDMFQSHDFIKEYFAIVEKNQKSAVRKLTAGTKFTVEKFMGRITGKSQKGKWGQCSEKNGGQYSKTDFEVVKEIQVEGKNCLLIKCNLYTGRTHQIRVHLSEEGYAILGDELYGGAAAKRMYLYSRKMECHNENLDFCVTAPVDFTD